jgi:hypothetical protein
MAPRAAGVVERKVVGAVNVTRWRTEGGRRTCAHDLSGLNRGKGGDKPPKGASKVKV